MRGPRLRDLPAPPSGRHGWPWTDESPPLRDTQPGGGAWPGITIVTPSYEQAEYLEATIRSVLLQGYPDLEYIVMDGGSSDGTVELLRRYEPWLAFWTSEPDEGPPQALNKGFARATGELLGYLNSDDFYLPGCLGRIAETMTAEPAVDILNGGGWYTDDSGRLLRRAHSDRWSLRGYAHGACTLFQPGSFFRRSAYRRTSGFHEANPVNWDGELWVDLALAGAQFRHVDDELAAFRLHPGSITGSGRLRERHREEKDRLFERITGRRPNAADRALGKLLRLRKFSSHPLRTLGSRRFFRSAIRSSVVPDS